MMKPDEVEAMLGLYELGWGTKRIAREFGRSRNTARRYVEAQGWVVYGGPRRTGKLAGLDAWLEELWRVNQDENHVASSQNAPERLRRGLTRMLPDRMLAEASRRGPVHTSPAGGMCEDPGVASL